MRILSEKLRGPAIAVVLLAALLSLGFQVPRGMVSGPGSTDSISGFASRYDELKRMKVLPDQVGYIGDRKPKDLQSVMAFMLTQYTLAPVVVEQSVAHEVVIGNYYSTPPSAEELRTHHLSVVKDFNNGVVLYRRVP